MKKFDEFLNENHSTRTFQYNINDDDYDNFIDDVKDKSDELNIKLFVNKIKGVRNITALFKISGDTDSVDELIELIKNWKQ